MLLIVPPNSAEAERVFSSSAFLCNKFRTRLGDITLDNLCFIRNNQQQIYTTKTLFKSLLYILFHFFNSNLHYSNHILLIQAWSTNQFPLSCSRILYTVEYKIPGSRDPGIGE